MTIAVDFDGVIHAYSRGWQDGSIYDPPLPGALDGLRQLMERDAVFVFTARHPEQVMPWLEGFGFDATTDERCETCQGEGGGQEVDLDGRPVAPAWECDRCKGSGLLMFWNQRGQLLVTNRKLAATAYLDDRAVRFTNWDQALADLAPVQATPEPPVDRQTARVRALHTRVLRMEALVCAHCGHTWPCDTIRALDGTEPPAT